MPRKATKKRKLNCADHSFNKKSNRTRARVEHPFIKHLRGYRKTRYRGLKENAAQVYTLFALANLYMARKKLFGHTGISMPWARFRRVLGMENKQTNLNT